MVKKFGGFRAVDRLSLDIRAGEFFALLGPSGCGKTTLLRMLAGFETPDEGRILLDGWDIAQLLPHERPVNMMFQNYALFPHLSVRDNIAFGLKRAGMAAADIAARVAEMVALVKLEGLEKRKPDQLSGGQKQRVALARALARRPRILLLDEPLAALDKKLRESTQAELMELQRRLGMTFIIVTHDQEEAMTVAEPDRRDGPGPSRTGGGAARALRSAGVALDRRVRRRHQSVRGRGRLARDGRAGDCDARRRHHRGRRAAPAGHQDQGRGRDPPRKGKAVAPRPGGRRRDHAHAINRLEGVVTDVGYLGGFTTYKVKLDSGAVLRSSMANTARIDIDAYSPSHRVVAWFTPDDCVVLEQ